MMEASILENDEKAGKASFILKGSNPAFVNTLRRNITDRVPTMAIEDVEFRKNSSILYDEVIAHRLGLIPLSTDLKSYNLPSECKCNGKGCARCTLKLTLSAKGPGIIYASSIKSKDPKVKPVYGDMPIVKLLKGQEIEIEATACLGTGKDHAKWSPGLVYYKNKPVIDILKNVSNPEDVAESCPLHVFDLKGGKIVVNKDKLVKCHLCGACADKADGAIKVGYEKGEFIFSIESWGQLSCREVVSKALDVFDNQIDEFTEKIKELK